MRQAAGRCGTLTFKLYASAALVEESSGAMGHRHVSDGCRTYWQAPADSVGQMGQELVDYAANSEGKEKKAGDVEVF